MTVEISPESKLAPNSPPARRNMAIAALLTSSKTWDAKGFKALIAAEPDLGSDSPCNDSRDSGSCGSGSRGINSLPSPAPNPSPPPGLPPPPEPPPEPPFPRSDKLKFPPEAD